MLYYHDRWTGAVCSHDDLQRLIEQGGLLRFQIPRRFKRLPDRCCRLLAEAEMVAASADQDRRRQHT